MKRIGIVGIGHMGHGIAGCLLRHGHALVGLAHPGNRPLGDLERAGLALVDTPAALAARCDAVLICVSDSPAVEAVVAGADGLLEGLREGALVVDCSTALPGSTLRLAALVRAAGGEFVDAAMTRTPREAAEGRLNLLVGAEPAAFARCRPLLACFAEHIEHVGPVGSGHRLKLLHNFVSLGMLTLLAEAAACAQRTGVAPASFVDVLARGGGGGTALARLAPYLLEGDASGLRFGLDHAAKDLAYYRAMADAAGVDARVASAVLASLEQALGEGDPAAPLPELVARIAGRR